MVRHIVALVILAWAWVPSALAGPVTLKLAYFSSDRSTTYVAVVKPFLDAVNTGGQGIVQIEPYLSGVLGKDAGQQAELIINGTTDLAYVVPGMTRDRFTDNYIIEMPGFYRDMREATLVYTRLIAANALKGYEEFFVIGSFVTEPESIHSRVPISSLKDLKDKKIRVNNPGEAAALSKLGAIPVLMQVNQVSAALGTGRIDAALVPPTPLVDFGIKRVATYHYMLETSGAPLLLLMNRNKFESLPQAVQDLIRKYSGEWTAQRFVEGYNGVERAIMNQLQSDPNRKVVIPSSQDLDTARAAFKAVLDEWVAISPRNRELKNAAQSELTKLRATR